MVKFKKLLAAVVAAALLTMSACTKDDSSAPSSNNPGITSSVGDDSGSVASSDDTGASSDTNQDSGKSPEEGGNSPINNFDKGTVSAEYTVASSWEDGGMTCSQLDVVVTNNTGKSIDGWTVNIELGQSVEIVQGWNAQLSVNENTLCATNVDYNAQLEQGAKTNFGCIVKTSSAISGAQISTGTSQSTEQPSPEVTTSSTTTSTTASSQTSASKPVPENADPTGSHGLVSTHGQLSVSGTDLVDESGNPMQLRGVSTHGIQWFPQFVNKQAFEFLRDEWGVNTMRIAMYSGESEGYNSSTREQIEQTLQNAVDACIELDMYVIIDWHVLADQSPQVRKADAIRFFDYISAKYADYPNVVYEICNEPNGYATWDGDVKPYAEEVIPVIRKNDPDSVIIVGTPTWSQDIDKALANPLKFDNIMYALHYYAATHTDWLRDRVRNCYNSGLPIFISEFGNCDASGGGSNDFGQAEKWFQLIDELNLSYMTWALSDKNETCSLLLPGASPTGGWNDSQLSENGKFMRNRFLSQ